jgi:hypothetical protein
MHLKPCRTLLLASVLLAAGQAAMAQQPRVRITVDRSGVTLVAQDATLSEILREWGRVTGTVIVNSEQVPDERVTLHLEQVTEREALGAILRSAAGYVAVRCPSTPPGVSEFARITIMAASRDSGPATTAETSDGAWPPISASGAVTVHAAVPAPPATNKETSDDEAERWLEATGTSAPTVAPAFAEAVNGQPSEGAGGTAEAQISMDVNTGALMVGGMPVDPPVLAPGSERGPHSENRPISSHPDLERMPLANARVVERRASADEHRKH